MGAQNLIFSGLNFVTISLDSSYVIKSIFGPISGGTALGPLFLFFPLFFLPFCLLLLIFYHFLFISSFLIFSFFSFFLIF